MSVFVAAGYLVTVERASRPFVEWFGISASIGQESGVLRVSIRAA